MIRGVSYDDTFINGNSAVTQGRVFHVASGVKAFMLDLRVFGGAGVEFRRPRKPVQGSSTRAT